MPIIKLGNQISSGSTKKPLKHLENCIKVGQLVLLESRILSLDRFEMKSDCFGSRLSSGCKNWNEQIKNHIQLSKNHSFRVHIHNRIQINFTLTERGFKEI